MDVVKWLVRAGADIGKADEAGQTALHCMAEMKFGDSSIEFLSEKINANSNVKNHAGETPFSIAIRNGNDQFAGLIFGKLSAVDRIKSLNDVLLQNDSDLISGVLRFSEGEHFPQPVPLSPQTTQQEKRVGPPTSPDSSKVNLGKCNRDRLETLMHKLQNEESPKNRS
jgi:hypothetical protein